MINKIREAVMKTFVGKERVVHDLLVCLLAGGHVLLEDVPGVGKTTLAKTLAAAIGADFGRIQFTPDTLPSDVTGVSVYNSRTGEFELKPGAVMHEIVLADEINRTAPKTQSALLEAMSEGQVTVDGKKTMLPSTFMVIATQNPVEFLGTYPLPEAQMDRFMMRLSIGYPENGDEILMARNHLEGRTVETAEQVCTVEDVERMKKEVLAVHVSDSVLGYVANIAAETRKAPDFVLGASPRATLALVRAAQAEAYLDGRDFVKPDDVKAVAVRVLHHRLVMTSEARIRRESMDVLITSLIYQARIPLERAE